MKDLEGTAAARGERTARVVLVVFAAALLTGLAAWLLRTYGFPPLRIVLPGGAR